MKARDLYRCNAGWQPNTELDVYVECEFKGRMPSHLMELYYGNFDVRSFNDSYIVLKEEIQWD